jgi:hypothetical protein
MDCTDPNNPNSARGHNCIVFRTLYQCGCNVATDCPVGSACNGIHQCTTSCGAGFSECNGGCCLQVAGVPQTCQPGNTQFACGLPTVNNGVCANCGNFMCNAATGTCL